MYGSYAHLNSQWLWEYAWASSMRKRQHGEERWTRSPTVKGGSLGNGFLASWRSHLQKYIGSTNWTWWGWGKRTQTSVVREEQCDLGGAGGRVGMIKTHCVNFFKGLIEIILLVFEGSLSCEYAIYQCFFIMLVFMKTGVIHCVAFTTRRHKEWLKRWLVLSVLGSCFNPPEQNMSGYKISY